MRIFTSFIALYMVLLSIAPCGDEKDCKIYSYQVTSISSADHSSEGGHTEEACTPFCSCNCCSVSMLKSYNIFPIKISEEHRDKDIDYSNVKLLKAPHFIWQPPKLV